MAKSNKRDVFTMFPNIRRLRSVPRAALRFSGYALFLFSTVSCLEKRAEIQSITGRELRTKIEESSATHPSLQATIVNIWATWCEPCKEEMPELAELQKEFMDENQVHLILVSADSSHSQDKARKFLEDAKVASYGYILGESPDQFVKAFEPRWSAMLPATFIFDKNGKLFTFWVGKTTRTEIKKKLTQLSNENLASQGKMQFDQSLRPKTGGQNEKDPN